MGVTAKDIIRLKAQHPMLAEAFDLVLVSGLSGNKKRAYSMLGENERSTRWIAERLNLTIFHASTILKQLLDLTVVERKEVITSEGRHFLWRCAGKG